MGDINGRVGQSDIFASLQNPKVRREGMTVGGVDAMTTGPKHSKYGCYDRWRMIPQKVNSPAARRVEDFNAYRWAVSRSLSLEPL